MNEIRISAEDPGFAIVPYWVLFSVSGNAVKLYGILRKYANNDTGIAHPSRSTLARDMGFSDPKSLSRLIRELEDIGALKVERRRLERAVNHYRVISHQPPPSARKTPEPPHVVEVGENPPLDDSPLPTPQVGEDLPAGRGESSPSVGDKTPHELDPLTRPKELEGETALFEAPPSTAIAVPETKPEALIAKRAYDGSNGALKYMAVFKLSQEAITHGYTPRQIDGAIQALWKAGRAINAQTLGQYLQGIISPTGQTAKPSTTNQRVGSALERAARYEQQAANAHS